MLGLALGPSVRLSSHPEFGLRLTPKSQAEGSACLLQAGVNPERRLFPFPKGQGLGAVECVNKKPPNFPNQPVILPP